MAKNNLPNPDDNVAATGRGTARKAVGTSAYTEIKNVSGLTSPNTMAVAKTNGRNPAALDGGTGHRAPMLADRLGAKFAPQVSMGKQLDPAAGAVQANGRIVPPSCVRSSFAGGAAD